MADLLFDWFGLDQTRKAVANSTIAKLLSPNKQEISRTVILPPLWRVFFGTSIIYLVNLIETWFYYLPFQLTDDEVTRIYRERNPLEKLAQLNSLKQRESSVVRDMIMARVGTGSRSASSPRTAAGIRRPRHAVLATLVPPPPIETEISMAPILNSTEFEQHQSFHIKSQSCHQGLIR